RVQVPAFSEASYPAFFPIVLGVVCLSEVGIGLFLRKNFITASEVLLLKDPSDQGALAKWRRGNLLSFVLAETVTLFGVVLKFMVFDWRILAAFFAGGLILLLFWMPRKIQAMQRGMT